MTERPHPTQPTSSAPPAHGHASDPHEPPPAPVLSIVSMDDDEDFRQYIAGVLRQQGHDVRAVGTAEEFFSACESRLPDAVLLDMKMGRTSGEDVLVELRKRWPRLCVIVVTGYPTLDSMRQTFKQDVFDYLAKPFSVEELGRVLGQAAAALGLGQRPQDRLRVELGRLIRMARTQRSWTLKDLSDACDLSVSQISSIERGAHLPSLESLLAIAAALETPPSTWFEASGF